MVPNMSWKSACHFLISWKLQQSTGHLGDCGFPEGPEGLLKWDPLRGRRELVFTLSKGIDFGLLLPTFFVVLESFPSLKPSLKHFWFRMFPV